MYADLIRFGRLSVFLKGLFLNFVDLVQSPWLGLSDKLKNFLLSYLCIFPGLVYARGSDLHVQRFSDVWFNEHMQQGSDAIN